VGGRVETVKAISMPEWIGAPLNLAWRLVALVLFFCVVTPLIGVGIAVAWMVEFVRDGA
jgi:hypothetical protein